MERVAAFNILNKGLNMYNCIIFDVDGTLIDTEDAVFSSYQKIVYEEFGRYFSPEELATGYGVPTNIALEGFGFKNIEEAGKKYNKYLMECYCDFKAFHGIPEVLAGLEKNNITTGIVTSRVECEITNDLCLQELMKYLKYRICADDTEKHKPDPEPILKFIEQSKADMTKTIYIGDTVFDYMCARSAGIHFGLALWGARNFDNIKADYYFKEPGEILNII